MKYLLDTDVVSYFLRGKYNLYLTFQQKGIDNLALSIVTFAELEVLAYQNPHSLINLSSIESLSRMLRLLDIDRETWQIYSMMKANCLTRGEIRGNFDILNASVAKRHGLIVVTNNISHYGDLVEVENWIQS